MVKLPDQGFFEGSKMGSKKLHFVKFYSPDYKKHSWVGGLHASSEPGTHKVRNLLGVLVGPVSCTLLQDMNENAKQTNRYLLVKETIKQLSDFHQSMLYADSLPSLLDRISVAASLRQ